MTTDADLTQEEVNFDAHLEEHGCGCPYRDRPGCPTPERHEEGHRVGGFRRCEEAMRLFRLLPPEKQVILT